MYEGGEMDNGEARASGMWDLACGIYRIQV